MPAKLKMYARRNAMIGRTAVYECDRNRYARAQAEGMPIEDGTTGVIVDTYDFDYPYVLELSDGRRHRAGRGLTGWTLDDDARGTPDCPNPVVFRFAVSDGGKGRIHADGMVDAEDGSFYLISMGFDSIQELEEWVKAGGECIHNQ